MPLTLIVGLLPLLLLGGAIAGVVALLRRRDEDEREEDDGIGTVRRLFLYGLAFIALMLALTGLALLVGGLFEAFAGDVVITDSDTELAIGLSLTLVGGVAWGLLWRVAEGLAAREAVERRSVARHVYYLGARGVTLAVAAGALVLVLHWALRIEDFQGEPLGVLMVWGAGWLFHLNRASREGGPVATTRTLDRLYWFGAAAGGLLMLGIGLSGALRELLDDAYVALFEDALIEEGREPLSRAVREAFAAAVVGGALWAGHWFWRARREAASTLWRVYVFLGGIGSGMATAIVAASVLLHRVLQWFLGEPADDAAVAHFDVLPAALAALILGAVLWGYHRAVLAEQAAEAAPRSETERVYRYLAAAAGLVTLVIGLAQIIAITLDLLASEGRALVGGDAWWQNSLVTGATLLLVGLPLWLRYWSEVERQAEARDADRASLARRTFLYGVFGVAALTALITLSIVLFLLFEGLLEGTLSREFLRDASWPLALLLVAAGVSAYYLVVLRADQRVLPAAAPRPRRREIVLVVTDDGAALAQRLEERLDARVRVWRRLDGTDAAPSEAEVTALVAQIEATPGDRLLAVLTPPADVIVIPYTPSE